MAAACIFCKIIKGSLSLPSYIPATFNPPHPPTSAALPAAQTRHHSRRLVFHAETEKWFGANVQRENRRRYPLVQAL